MKSLQILGSRLFFENYKRYAGDVIFQNEDAKLTELLNVRQKTRLSQSKQFVTISDPFTLTKRSMYDLVLTQM